MRIIIKGGVWKNTEDEILKAAVMKYGKNQWARISSLLNRKTPKQCKARWYEWLDPSIKKTEWSREEDEKLLHLAKLMPTQWRTIAPIVGRTPSQCLERYQKLLDEAEMKEGEEDQGQTSEDIRRLRPGEIDPDLESKPARPDPIDMDEDEKEMLSEARARLANTQGKKAKRKAREKQLEESRRLAALQKRRELKAAGIELKYRKKTKGMNYNADIPFHKKAPAGFWDTTEEHERELREKKDQTNILLQKLEGKRRADIEEAERKKDIKRQKQRKEKGESVPQAALKALDEQKKVRTERRKLVLPAPQISESELEEIAKIGYSSEKLIADSASSTASTPLSTPLSTPRLLESQRSSHSQLSGGRTPIRDEMGINTPMSSSGASSIGSETPRMERARQNLIRKQLNEQFSHLPKPKNDFELVVPSKEEDAELAKEDTTEAMEEDAEDVRVREKKLREEAEARRKKLQSHPVQENLPRPHVLEFDQILNEATNDIEREIALEMIAMMAYDAKKNPYPPSQTFGKMEEPEVVEAIALGSKNNHDTKYTLEELDEANRLIEEEMNVMMQKIKIKDISSEFEKAHDRIEKEDVYVVDPDTKIGSYVPLKKMKKDEKIQNLKQQLESNRTKMSKEAAKARKLEKRLAIILGGYQNRGQRLKKEIMEQWKQLEQVTIEYEAYNDLKQNEENIIISHREEELTKSVQVLEQRENELQQKYRELMAEYNTLL
jgi:pre-mRNA-splicing factor CDC5/CEF1